MTAWPQHLQKIGAGTFGQVYLVAAGNSPQALKVIKYKEVKNPALYECFVMSSFNCPFLHRASEILIDTDKIGIVSQLALSNCQKQRRNGVISPEILQKWIFRLLVAIDYLHSCKLIHGDIKASNILYFSNDDIRLADFGLTRPIKFRHRFARPCSPTHRPLEVWLGSDWNESVDIWAFGCAVFELVFGYSLFPLQTSEKGSYTEITSKFVACLEHYFSSKSSKGSFNIALLPDKFSESPFSRLILDCLSKDHRPSASTLLAKYFPQIAVPKIHRLAVKISPYDLPEFVQEKEAQALFQELRAQLDLEFSPRRSVLLRGLYRLAKQLIGLPVDHHHFSEEIEVCRELGFGLAINLN